MDQLLASDPPRIGPYRLIARLGAGGMGRVYLGRSGDGRTVAIKVVQEEYAQNPEFRWRFAREVAAARLVGGLWTADVLDADTEAVVPWLATQYIPGPDLATVVGTDFGPLPAASVWVLANRLALALRAVHGAGLVHRDLKPSNVLVTVDGPRVIDFGIARALDSLTDTGLLTRTGMLIGSPGFMSPEQARGRELTPTSDVFSLGAVLVYAATSRYLFGADEEGLNAHLFRIVEEEPDLAGVPEPLLDVVRACLEKDPDQRPDSQWVADRTASSVYAHSEWLPSPVLGQLVRHAAQLLDYAPRPVSSPADDLDGAAADDAGPVSAQPGSTAPQQPPAPPPPAHDPAAPTTAVPPPRTTPYVSPTVSAPAPPLEPPVTPPSRQRWWRLTVSSVVQLLVWVDWKLGFAYPYAVEHLESSQAALAPMTFTYPAALGALALAGGCVSDRWGRRATLFLGLGGYMVASVLCVVIPNVALLVLGRTLQGACSGLLLSAVLAQVSADFPDPRARARAFGVHVAVAVGFLVALFPAFQWVAWAPKSADTLWVTYLWAAAILFVCAVVGVAALPSDPPVRSRSRLDVPGLLLGSCGILALFYGLCTLVEASSGQNIAAGVAALSCGAVLLPAFVWWQVRAAEPLVPLPTFSADRGRASALAALCLITGTVGSLCALMFLHLLFFYLEVQPVLPPGTGSRSLAPAAVLTLSLLAAVISGPVWVSALVPRFPVRRLVVSGLLVTALGLQLLTRRAVWQLSDASSANVTAQAAELIPAVVLSGIGLYAVLTPLHSLATSTGNTRKSGGSAALTAAVFFVSLEVGSLLEGAVLSAELADFRDVMEWLAPCLTLLVAMAAAALLRPTAPRHQRSPS